MMWFLKTIWPFVASKPSDEARRDAVADAAHQQDLALEEAKRQLEWDAMTEGTFAGGSPFPN